jgi:hypothetical protein
MKVMQQSVTASKHQLAANSNTGTVSGSGTFYGIKKLAGRSLDLEYKLDLDWNI